jgi:hypothetical protein
VTGIVGWLNAALTGLFGLAFLPFRRLDPFWALLVVSCATGVLMLWIFGKISDQATIKTVRDRIRGNLLGVRIFGDDIGLLFRLQGKILSDTGRYLRHALVPMLVTIVPVLLVLIQMNLWFGFRPLEPGERATVKVAMRDASALAAGVTLETGDGLVVETPGVPAPALNEVVWRVRAAKPGKFSLVVRSGSEQVSKDVAVGGGGGPVSTLRTGRGISEMLLYPGEKPIGSEAAVRAVEIDYPARHLSALGFGIDWMIFFFVASIAFGFLMKGPLGIEV